jgi:ABC-type phosphate/phosphonate transport system ATPase subunit
MQSVHIVRESAIDRSPRVMMLEGMFDIPVVEKSRHEWDVALDLPDKWNIGVIVGPSGCGKTTITRELFKKSIADKWPWKKSASVIDSFPASMSLRDVTALLSSVGFSSPPSWLKPFSVLSNGEQFRVHLARTLAEIKDIAVVDEFTSVVDRTVAKIGSAAIAKTVRRRGQKLIAVSCHYDILDWLEPDWVYEPAIDRLARGSLWRRPKITLNIRRVDKTAWQLFRQHHYLSADLHRASSCFCAFVENQPAAFCAILSFPHPVTPSWRIHRLVTLPDFQGVGIGNALMDFCAGIYAETKPVSITTSHPALMRSMSARKNWLMTSRPGHRSLQGKTSSLSGDHSTSAGRITAGFRFRGKALSEEYRNFGLDKSCCKIPVAP